MWALLLGEHFGAGFKSATRIRYQELRNHARSSGVASDIPSFLCLKAVLYGLYVFYVCTRKIREWYFGPDGILHQPAQRFQPPPLSPQSHTTGQRRILRIPFLKEQVASLRAGCRAQKHWHMCLALPMNSCTEATEPEHTCLALKHRPKCLLDWN